MESGILGFEIRNPTQGIWNLDNDCNPKSKFHWQGIHSPVPEIQNLRLFWRRNWPALCFCLITVSLRSRPKKERARLPLVRSFFLAPTTSKRLLRRLDYLEVSIKPPAPSKPSSFQGRKVNGDFLKNSNFGLTWYLIGVADFWHVVLEWCPKNWMHILRFEFSLVSKIQE